MLYVGALIQLVVVVAVCAQNIERRVVAAAGSAGRNSSVQMTWTVGETSTERFDFGAGMLTQGFQQPYSGFAILRTENFAGSPGERREMNILLDGAGTLPFMRPNAIRLKLRFNSTLLEPLSTTPQAIILSDSIAYGRRVLDMVVPMSAGAATGGALATIGFKIGLGNDSLTAMELLDASPIGEPLRIRTVAGTFKLLGICYQGGPRLVDPVERISIALRPNPVSTVAEMEFDLRKEESVRVMVVDLLGRMVKTIADEPMRAGHYQISFDASDLPGGSYTVVLETPSLRASRPMIVRR
jgi:hypothetical protein